ncbi:MAG: transglutaminase-like domain-containing protein [Verrucomicrobiales bacterium]
MRRCSSPSTTTRISTSPNTGARSPAWRPPRASTAGEADDPASLRNGLSEYLFNRCGFHGSRGDYYHASNSYLNEVIDDREGIPITLSVLYIELARQIGIPGVTGAPVPGHFLVRHDIDGTDPVFIDAFDYGNRLDRAGVEELAGMALEDEHLQPSPKKTSSWHAPQSHLPPRWRNARRRHPTNTALTIDSEDAESLPTAYFLRFRAPTRMTEPRKTSAGCWKTSLPA